MSKKNSLSLIIEKPGLAPLPNRIGWGGVTVLFWLVWIYLWLPFITTLAWVFGYRQLFLYFHSAEDFSELAHLAILYGTIITVLGGSLLLWAHVEYRRFRNVNRRERPSAVSVEELAVYVGVPSDDMRVWQHSRCVRARHDNEGRLIGVDIRS